MRPLEWWKEDGGSKGWRSVEEFYGQSQFGRMGMHQRWLVVTAAHKATELHSMSHHVYFTAVTPSPLNQLCPLSTPRALDLSLACESHSSPTPIPLQTLLQDGLSSSLQGSIPETFIKVWMTTREAGQDLMRTIYCVLQQQGKGFQVWSVRKERVNIWGQVPWYKHDTQCAQVLNVPR